MVALIVSGGKSIACLHFLIVTMHTLAANDLTNTRRQHQYTDVTTTRENCNIFIYVSVTFYADDTVFYCYATMTNHTKSPTASS